ncbi:MAG: DUF6056 family protein [Lachnospiraceae bacterium]|nr:DUF6056 family protein [Lachnospiraceae bacterium]
MNRIIDGISLKKINFILKIVLIASVISVIVIGVFDRPSADDYSFGIMTKHVWDETHNIFLVLFEALKKTADFWMRWTGDFTTNFLMALPPCIFGEKCYVLTPVIMLSALIFSILFLGKQLVVNVLGYSRNWSRCISYLILLVLIQCMISPVEGFYWYNGSSKYLFLNSLLLIFYGLLIKLYYENTKINVKVVLVSAFGFIVAGGNQMSSLNGVLVLGITWFCLTKVSKEHKGNVKVLILPSVFYFLGFLINVLAPGNRSRASVSSGMNPIKAVFVSLYDYLYLCIDEWTTWPVVLMILVLIPVFYRMFIFKKCNISFRYPILVVILGFLLTSAMMTPPLFGTGNMEAGRLQNVTFITYILTLVISEGYVIGWYVNRAGLIDGKEEFGKNEKVIILALFVAFIVGAMLTVVPKPHYFASSSAVHDLLNGTAKTYASEMDTRVEKYEVGGKVLVSSLSERPYLLYFSDIEGDGNEWIRDAVCRYYDLEGIEFEGN